MSTTTAVKAKKFLVNRILEQAQREDVPLSDIEIRMLGFAEDSANAKDMEAAAVFERDYNDEEYEAKVAELLGRAYKRDKEGGEEAGWNEALADLAGEDIYLLVMLKRAGIETSNPFSYLLDWRLISGLLPACIVVAAAAVLAFSPFGSKLVPNGFFRLLLILLLLVVPFAISKIGRRPTG